MRTEIELKPIFGYGGHAWRVEHLPGVYVATERHHFLRTKYFPEIGQPEFVCSKSLGNYGDRDFRPCPNPRCLPATLAAIQQDVLRRMQA